MHRPPVRKTRFKGSLGDAITLASKVRHPILSADTLTKPSAFSHVTSTGLEEYIQGGWCCAFTAQYLTDMKVVRGAFFREFMGLGLPVRDNGFMHEMPQHKYLTRKNKTTNNRWDSRYTMRLEYMGVATQSVQSFVQGMMESHSFLMWNGEYCADLLGLPRKKFHFDCSSEEEVSQTWLAFQQTRLKSACPMADFPAHIPQRRQTLPPTSLLVQWQTSPSTLPPSIVQAPSPATPPDALRQLPPAIVQPPCPPTPPDTDIDASISHASQHIVEEAPGSEPQFKRARLNSICDQQNDSLQCQGGQPAMCG